MKARVVALLASLVLFVLVWVSLKAVSIFFGLDFGVMLAGAALWAAIRADRGWL